MCEKSTLYPERYREVMELVNTGEFEENEININLLKSLIKEIDLILTEKILLIKDLRVWAVERIEQLEKTNNCTSNKTKSKQ
jgi:hypothetical protein